METFKIVLIGEGEVGKTTYLKRLMGQGFEEKYDATLGVEVLPIRFQTNYGEVCLNFWDCAGQERFRGLREGYFVQAHGALVFFNLSSIHTFNQVSKWENLFKGTSPNVPILIVGNKMDMDMETPSMDYFMISTKDSTNIREPIQDLLRELMKKGDLILQ